MASADRHQPLIEALGAGLTPVRRLASPWRRTLGWLLAVAALAVGLFAHYGAAPMLERMAATPALIWLTAGALLTAIGAALAAFKLAVPGNARAWAWLPLPGAMLWLGTSGWGCLEPWFTPGTHVATPGQQPDCLVFIVGFAIPLAALMIWLVRRACPLRPTFTAVLIGLASAAASAALLQIGHAFADTVLDLATHVLAVVVVVAANAAMGGRLLSRRDA